MNEQQRFELIEKFINAEMHGDELINFEKKLQDDIELQKEVNLHKEINLAIIEDNDIMKLRKKLESIKRKIR